MPSVGWEVDRWNEVAEAFEYVASLHEQEGAAPEEGKVVGTHGGRLRNGEAWFEEDGEGCGSDEDDYGPDAESGAESVVVEKILEEERDNDAAEACSCL